MVKIKLLYRVSIAAILLLILAACGPGINDEPPLHDAAARGDVAAVEQLLKDGVNVNSKNSEGATPLHWAAFKGEVAVAKILLARGANINAKTRKGSTPLRLATTHKKAEMVRFLERRGGKVE